MYRKIENTDARSIKEVFNDPARPIIGVDVEKYKALLDDPTLTETEKENFLQALWSVVVAFVELGFGVHPLQEVCEPESGQFLGGPNEAFDRAEQQESNNENQGNGGPSGSPEIE